VNAALVLVTHDLAIAHRLSKQIELSAINRAAVASPLAGGGGGAQK
jgi:predicted ABC-type transport system involved in lysophospholipase L1 biosynthesis ATPase subunit